MKTKLILATLTLITFIGISAYIAKADSITVLGAEECCVSHSHQQGANGPDTHSNWFRCYSSGCGCQGYVKPVGSSGPCTNCGHGYSYHGH